MPQDSAKRPWSREAESPLKPALGLKRTLILSELRSNFHSQVDLCQSWARRFSFESATEDYTLLFHLSLVGLSENPILGDNSHLAMNGRALVESMWVRAWTRFYRCQHNPRVRWQLDSSQALIALQTWSNLDCRGWTLCCCHFYNYLDAQAKIYFAPMYLVFSKPKKKFLVLHQCEHWRKKDFRTNCILAQTFSQKLFSGQFIFTLC